MSGNFVRYGNFKCECGREFEKSQSLYMTMYDVVQL